MTEEQQELYDVVSDWWDEIFIEPTKGRWVDSADGGD